MILKLNILKYGIDMKEALQGLKLIDLTRVRSGPSAVRQFADWGADVIKIETPDSVEGSEDLEEEEMALIFKIYIEINEVLLLI